MKVADLKKQIDSNNVWPFYIFTGEEKEVMRKYLHKLGAVNKAPSFSSIVPKLRSNSLFQSAIRQVYVIDSDKKMVDMGAEKVSDALGNTNNIVVLLWDKIDGRSKFFKDFKKLTVEFEKFDTNYLVGYVQRFLPDATREIAQTIVEYSNHDVSRIELECHKLFHYDGKLTMELVNELILPPLDNRIFDMIDGVAKRDKAKVLRIYYDLLELGESPVKILSLLTTKFKQVFQVQSYINLSNKEIAEKTGLTPFIVNITKGICGTFSLPSLMKIIKEAQETEVAIKTGKRDIDLQVELLILKFFWKA